ncbi:MAG: hypothetical protein JNK82_19555 [Myxococcaceae bacterium]|nr:hypothetical protein [Myxococcaceae bacterium]
MGYRVVIAGGTGQVGRAVVQAFIADPSCTELVMVNRRAGSAASNAKVREAVLDTSAPSLQQDTAALVRETASKGDTVVGASCIGVGTGSMKWSEEDLKALEVGVVGAFARGCRDAGVTRFGLLSAVGSSSSSMFRYVRVMGLKEENIAAVGFERLAIFRPGIIGGIGHTPGAVAVLGRWIPGKFGTVEADDIAGAFVTELTDEKATGVTHLENGDLRASARRRTQNPKGS